MDKNRFYFHFSFFESLRDLSGQELRQVVDAIELLSATGEDTSFADRYLRAVWSPICCVLKRERENYEVICQRNKKNGQLGGRPENPVGLSENPENPVGFSENPKNPLGFSENPENPVGFSENPENPVGFSENPENPVAWNRKNRIERIESKEEREKNITLAPTIEEIKAYCSGKGYSIDAERFKSFYDSKGWMSGSTPIKDWRPLVDNWKRLDDDNARKKNASANNFEQHEYSDEYFKKIELEKKNKMFINKEDKT